MSNPKRILVVDDEPANRDLLEAMLARLGHDVVTAEDGSDALAKLDAGFDLVLSDVMMPKMDGYELVSEIRSGDVQPDIPICMVTALDDMDDRLRAVKAGANDYIAKPVDRGELEVRTDSLLKIKEQQDIIKRHQEELEITVKERTTDLRHALSRLESEQSKTYSAHLETIDRLATAAEYKDEDTANHIKRMAWYSRLLAERAGLPRHDVDVVFYASPMHDVGKIGIPDAILLKPGKLTGDEWVVMRQHTTIGGRILGGSTHELLNAGETIAMSHHEKWDGSGYPEGLAGEDIPLWGRICAVADVFDALTTVRPYKKAFSLEKSLGIMREGRGLHFDPDLLDLFTGEMDEVVAIKERYSDALPGDQEAT